MPPTLYGVSEKRNWAEHHLKLVEVCIGDFINSNPCRVITDPDPKHGIYHARLVYPDKLPFRTLSLMIGDCVHNMRAALDYMAWELAGANIADTGTMFPIFNSPAGFKTRGLKRVKGLPKDAQTAIERLQPYNTRYGGHLLALDAINKIDAADKHKILTVAVAIAELIECVPALPGNIRPEGHTFGLRHYPNVRLVHNAIVATCFVAPPIPQVEVHFKVTPQVEFGHIPGFDNHAFVLPNLRLMLDSVDMAIKRLKPFFK